MVLSTIYSAGRRSGVVGEELHDDCGFVNFYEWSKWEAERHVLTECADLPAAVVRLATVIADDETGAVTQYNVFHNTLKLFYYGLMSLVPGDETTPTYLITGVFAADAIAAVLAAGGRGVFNACTERADAPTLGELVNVAFDVFERHDDFRRRRLLRPLFCDREGFDHLVDGARTLGMSPLNQAVASMAPFARRAVHRQGRPQRPAARRVARLRADRRAGARRSYVRAPRAHAVGARSVEGVVSEPISENDLWLLSYYRTSEINGALFFGRIARTVRSSALQADITRHFADEANHARWWSECIDDLGHEPVRQRGAYQDQYLEAAGVPINLMEVLAVTQVFERRVIGQYRQHLKFPGTHPRVRETLRRIMEDERWHVKYVREALDTMAETHGRDAVDRALERFAAADREVYEKTVREYGERVEFLRGTA